MAIETSRVLRVGTRGSALAVSQTRQVIASIQELIPGLVVEMVTITTKGDLHLGAPLHEVGGKGLFVKEIEDAMLAGGVDLAVHSAKDMPAELPPGLVLAAFPARVDPRDAVISRTGCRLDDLPPGSRVGTSSLRRVFQLSRQRPDLVIEPLRGNVDTRLRKLREGRYDAIILAAAGLTRLGLAGEITEYLEPSHFIPAVGQGALAIETREDDSWARAIADRINDPATEIAVRAERAYLARIEGGCQVPAGGHCRLEGDAITLDAFLASPDGKFFARDSLTGPAGEPEKIGLELAERLLARCR